MQFESELSIFNKLFCLVKNIFPKRTPKKKGLRAKMKVLIIGSGGREHALVWKLAQSQRVEKIYAAPGNPGMENLAECVPIHVDDLEELLRFAREKSVDLTVVGPELPLVHGIVDLFEAEGLKVFGPSRKAAQIEGSKSFAKNFMARHGIPTARFEVFSKLANARNYIWNHEGKLVIKADGLAAGKGSIVCGTKSEAQKALEEMMLRNVFGEAGHRVVIEEFLEGEEISVLALSDGKHILPLVPSRDHKAAYDDDLGPNTGGMGAYAPSPFVSDALMDEIRRTVLEPTIHGLAEEGYPYKGVLYAGLMLTENGPKVIEFNCRFGDPETQVVLPLIESDLADLMLATIDGTLGDVALQIRKAWAVCVVMASGGYPGSYEKGKLITGLGGPFEKDVVVFHAGTKRVDQAIVTNGGRVLGVTKKADSLEEAIAGAYRAVKQIHFDGAFYRRDIARKGLDYLAARAM